MTFIEDKIIALNELIFYINIPKYNEGYTSNAYISLKQQKALEEFLKKTIEEATHETLYLR